MLTRLATLVQSFGPPGVFVAADIVASSSVDATKFMAGAAAALLAWSLKRNVDQHDRAVNRLNEEVARQSAIIAEHSIALTNLTATAKEHARHGADE